MSLPGMTRRACIHAALYCDERLARTPTDGTCANRTTCMPAPDLHRAFLTCIVPWVPLFEQTAERAESLAGSRHVCFPNTNMHDALRAHARRLSRTDEMFQHLLEPKTAVNMIVFKAFGILKGCVTLRGEFEVRVIDVRQAAGGIGAAV